MVAPEEDVIFTVSYIQQQIALPIGTGGGATPLEESLPSIQSLTRFEDQEVLFISIC